MSHTNSYQRCIQLQKENPANITTIAYRTIRYVLLTTKVHIFSRYSHRRQPRRGCRGRIATNILVGGDINGNVPTNIRGINVVEYELKTLET